MTKSAIFSDDHKHRYLLTRIWDESKPLCCFIMTNPSDADDKKDDPTVKRCISFAVNWGYGGFYIGNLSPFIATNPKDILNIPFVQEICVKNNIILNQLIQNNNIKLYIYAWGNIPKWNSNTIELLNFMFEKYNKQPYCIKQNKDGSPAHPLYLKSNLKPIPYKHGKEY